MSDVSELSDVELSPSTDSLDTLMGFETEAGRTTVVSQSSSSVNQPASSDNAIGSSDSESIHVSPRAAKGEGTQDGRADRVGLPETSTGQQGELAKAGASAPTTGPGHPPPPVDMLAMLISLQAQQKQQQEILTALTEQLRLDRQQPGPREAGTLPTLPLPPAPPPANQGQGQLPVPPYPPPSVRSARRDESIFACTQHHRARRQRRPNGPQHGRSLPARASNFPQHLSPAPGSECGQRSTFP